MDNECDTFSVSDIFISEVKRQLSLPHEVGLILIKIGFFFKRDKWSENVLSSAFYWIAFVEIYFFKLLLYDLF